MAKGNEVPNLETMGPLLVPWSHSSNRSHSKDKTTTEITVSTMAQIKVGPLGAAYVYRIGNRISQERYVNAASAWADAERPQRVNGNGNLEPDIDPNGTPVLCRWDSELHQYMPIA